MSFKLSGSWATDPGGQLSAVGKRKAKGGDTFLWQARPAVLLSQSLSQTVPPYACLKTRTPHYKAIGVPTVCTDMQTDPQIDEIDNPEINPYVCSQLIYDEEGKSIQRGKDSLFNKKALGELNMQKIETGPLSHAIRKNKFKIY